MDVAVRVYNRRKASPAKRVLANSGKLKGHDIPDYERILAFDCECRSDAQQTLTFGSYVIMHNNAIEGIGLYYAPEEVTATELRTLQDYCKDDPTIKLYPLKEFIEVVFYPTVYDDKAICTGFNMPFDLARLAIDFGYAKGWMKGGFAFKLSEDKRYPSIRVKHIDTAESLIKFQGTRISKFQGNFVDCQKIAAILTDSKRISLKQAAQLFNKKYKKLEVSEHGGISRDYISYNITDTLATAELFTHLREEYGKYGIKLPLTEVYSSASMGKAFLEELGIKPFMKLNPNFPPELLGKLAQGYYGGRCECRKRRTPTKVSVLDFTSQYPTLFLLLGLYDYLIAERTEYVDDTINVKKLLEEITLEDLRNPETWKKLIALVEIKPDDDLLPVRAEYSKDIFTVGLNHISCKKALYYGLPSIILSKLLTGKIPKIKSAIRFVPIGRQSTMKKSKILGMNIDPNKENIFKILVEERHKAKRAGDVREKCIKIIVNSTSYGIYMELNREEEKSDLIVYSGNETFPETKRFEKEGRYYNPIIATFITDGAKLLLGIGDCILKRHDETIAYADTDSLHIPPKYANEIVEFFDDLNPYSNVSHLLKMEQDDIWFYGISAKRYCLFDIDAKGNFIIRDDPGDENYSLHGLGHLSNPFGSNVKRWQKEVWLDILRLEYHQMTVEDMLNKYRSFFALSQFTISTASLMRRFKPLNRGRPYSQMIKPFNFFMIGFSNMSEIKPIAPFSSDPQAVPYGDFINYKTGRKMRGQEYFKSLADELWPYINHSESKLDGDIGTLQRRHITADRIIYMGKEADKIEENMSGLSRTNYNIYNNPKDTEILLTCSLKQALASGMSKSQFYGLRKRIKEGKTPHLRGKTLRSVRQLYEL